MGMTWAVQQLTPDQRRVGANVQKRVRCLRPEEVLFWNPVELEQVEKWYYNTGGAMGPEWPDDIHSAPPVLVSAAKVGQEAVDKETRDREAREDAELVAAGRQLVQARLELDQVISAFHEATVRMHKALEPWEYRDELALPIVVDGHVIRHDEEPTPYAVERVWQPKG